MASRIFRQIRSTDHPGSRRSRDEAATVRTAVAEFSSANHISEVKDGRLTVYHTRPGLDAADVRAGLSMQARDAESATLRSMAEAAKKLWGR